MDSIQQKAIKTFQDNLDYFEKNHPLLHSKLVLLDTAISNGTYHERFSLEYKDEGYFDVLEMESNHYLYGKNSIEHAKTVMDSMDFTRVNGVFEAQRFVDFSPEMPDIIDQSKLHFQNALWATIKIVEYFKKVASRYTTHMKAVYKLIFLGVGLGVHIQGIAEKMGAKILFMREEDLELFRLSLFVTNYAKLSKKLVLFFSVMEDEPTTQKTFIQFLDTGNNYNLFLKQISLTADYEQDLFRYQNFVALQDHIMYPYSAYLLRHIDSPRYIAAGHSVINIRRFHQESYLSAKPLLFLFSGPSTANHIEWIQANKERFVIVTALSTCRYLYKQNIKPDIVMHMDPEEHATLLLLEGIEDSFFENTVCVFASNVHAGVVGRFNPKNLYFIQQAGEYKSDFGAFSSPTVGEYSYAVFMMFGGHEFYLLGIDLALDPDSLASHSPEHPFAEFASKDEGRENQQLEKTVIEVAGNFLPKVPSYPGYKLAANEFGRMSRLFKINNQRVYNLSNGALLDGAEPKKAADIDTQHFNILDKQSIHEELKSFFDSISSNEFREEDKKQIRYQLDQARKLRVIIENFKKNKFAMSSLYIGGLSKLQWELADMENKLHSDLSEVYYHYFKVVLSYICEIFNTREMTNEKEHIQAINGILITQLEKIANTFIQAMEGYLNEEN